MPPPRYLTAALLALSLRATATATEVTINNRHFTLPDGFTIELVAAPPLVNRPITADFDDAGHLYVADSSGSADKPQKQLEEKPHRILKLTDTHGNGVFDHSEVFADHMMFPEGTLWLDGSLYVAAPPSIWKLNADGSRAEWFQGKTLTGCANDLHGPYLGPDGLVYWCKGAFAEQTYELPNHKKFTTRAAHLFRARPDSSGVEPVMTGGMDNPVEITFTPGGERIFSCTFLQNPANGRRDGLIHAVYGGIYGKVHDVIDDHPHTFPEVMPVLYHAGPAAECALTRYEGDAFGPDYRDNLFASSFNLHKVTRHVLTPDGATFKSTDSDFLVCDSLDFHPTHLVEDADGSLLVVDTGGWYKLCCPTSQIGKPDVLGAIYRVRRVGPKAITQGRGTYARESDDPRGLKIDWDKATFYELAMGLLGDPRFVVQKRAIATLVQRGKAPSAALANPRSVQARLNAVWVATRIHSFEARGYFIDRDETVRHAAAHAASVWRDHEALPALLEMLATDSPQNRRVAAEALGRISDAKAVAPLLAALEQPADHVLEHSLTYALIEIADGPATAAGLSNPNPHVRRAAMMALDQMDPPGPLSAEVVAKELSATDPALRDTASWIAARHPEWGDALAATLGERLRQSSLSADDRAQLQTQLARLAKAPAIQSLLADAMKEGGERRLIALAAVGESGLKSLPANWNDAITAALGCDNAAAVSAAASAVRRLATKDAPFGDALLRAGQRESLSPDARLDALSAIPGGLKKVPPPLFDFLVSQLAPHQAAGHRTLSAQALGRAQLTDDQLRALTSALRTAGPLEINELLLAYRNATDEPLGLQLVAALREAKSARSLRADQVKPRLAKFGPKVQAEVDALLAKLNPDAAEQKAKLDQLLTALPPGDVRRGQAVFNSPKVACVSCHAIGYVGGHVGPDLTRVGSVRAERDLLESIVYPSASFAQSFEPYTAVTTTGQRYDGVLRRNDATEVMLVTGPDQEAHIPRAELKDLRPGTLSIMPSGLDQQLSPQELSDLVTFLKACK